MENHLAVHSFDSKFSFFPRCGLPLFFSIDIRNISVFDLFFRDKRFDAGTDLKTGSIGIREDYNPGTRSSLQDRAAYISIMV